MSFTSSFQQSTVFVILLFAKISFICAALPIDVPNQIVSSCSTDSDCPNYLHSKCEGGTCTSCSSDSQCNHIYSPGSCFFGMCVIPCSNSNTDPCTAVRTRCFSFLGFIGNLCTECNDDGDCSALPGTAYCQKNSDINLCVNCRTNADCPSTSTCQDYKCVQCTSNTDCSDATAPYCLEQYQSNTCSGCTDNSHCSHIPNKPYCFTSTGACVECLDSSACGTDSTKSVCNTVSNVCEICTTSSDCSTNFPLLPVCASGVGCVECASNDDCPSTSLSFCSPNLYKCQRCTQDAHCTHIAGMNKCFSGECIQYIGECPSTYSITITQQQDPSVFSVLVSAALASQIDFAQSLWIQLVGIDTADYTYSLVKLSDTAYEIDFEIQKTIPQTNLYLEVPCPAPSGILYPNITEKIAIKRISFSTAELVTTVGTITAVANTVSTSVTIVTAIMMFIGSNPAILWALIGLFQTFYYMLFINVQYPANVEAFFPIFTMGNLNFIPNPMNMIFPDINDFSLPVPQKFADYGVDGLFLSNAGDMLLLWFLNLAVYGLCFLLLKYARNMPRLLSFICMKSVDVFEWSGTIRTFITSFMEISVASFLQLRVLVFDSGLFVTSSVCGIIFATFSMMLPVAAFKIVEIYDTKPKLITKKFATLIEDYELNDGIQKYFTVINIGRNLIMASTLVYLHNYPYIEIITLISTSFSFAYLICKHRPYESKTKNVANFISEFVFGIIYLLIFILIHDDYSPSLSDNSRLNVGWGIICACGIILVTTLLVSLYEQYGTLKETMDLLRKFIRKTKRTPKARMKNLQLKIKKVNPKIEDYEDHLEEEETLDKSTDLSTISVIPPSSLIFPPRPSHETRIVRGHGRMPKLPLKLYEIMNRNPPHNNEMNSRPSQQLIEYCNKRDSNIISHEVYNQGPIYRESSVNNFERIRFMRRNRPFHLRINK